MKIFKYSIVLMLLLSSYSYAGEERSEGLVCDTKNQTTTSNALWKCPPLKKAGGLDSEINTYSELSEILPTGRYTCDYREMTGGKLVQRCVFTSSAAENGLENSTLILFGTPPSSTNPTGTLGKVEAFKDVDFEKDLNPHKHKPSSQMGKHIKAQLAEIQARSNEVIKLLKKLKESSDGSKITKIDSYLSKLDKISYKYLIAPYTASSPTSSIENLKNSNMALFIAGMITLDPDVVKGYNTKTGKLDIQTEWVNSATTTTTTITTGITDHISNKVATWWNATMGWTGLYKANEESTPSAENVIIQVSSWVDLFQLKLWGFYYNLQRRLDIGYDILSMTLFWTMALWFSLMLGAKGGVAYLMNREEATRKTEAGILKTIGMILVVGVFFISIPTPKATTAIAGSTEAVDIKDEMRKNRTIAKYMIRYTASQGSKLATMMSDLGLEAFLSYVTKKQNVNKFSDIVNQHASELSHLTGFYTLLPLMEECRGYFNASDLELANANIRSNLTVDDTYTSTFFTNNEIKGLSLGLCKSAYQVYAQTPYMLALGVETTAEKIKSADVVMAKAVFLLASNQIIMQQKLGWINSFSVPITYFMMKHNDLFMTDNIDYDKVQKNAEKYFSQIGLVDGGAIEDSALINMSDSLAKVTAQTSAYISGMYMYNMLPFYSDIQKSIHSLLSNIYAQKLDLHRSKNKGSAKKLFKEIFNLAKEATGKATLILAPIVFIQNMLHMESVFLWNLVIQSLSMIMAIFIWNITFAILFLSSVSILVLLKTVLYFKDLMVHVLVSPFVVAWAFVSGGQGSHSGESKIMGFIKDTMVLMFYPSLIVISSFTFIFIYELFYTLYAFLMSALIVSQKSGISLMTVGAGFWSGTDTTSAYYTLYLLEDLSEILVDIFGLILALIIILKLPEFILKKLGLGDSDALNISNTAETISHKGDKNANPML